MSLEEEKEKRERLLANLTTLAGKIKRLDQIILEKKISLWGIEIPLTPKKISEFESLREALKIKFQEVYEEWLKI